VSQWFARLRRIVGARDRELAYAREATELGDASRVTLVDRRFEREMESRARGHAHAVTLGSAVHRPDLAVRLPLAELLGGHHAVTLGASGSGKTYFLLNVFRQLATAMTASRGRFGIAVVDHKSEFVPLLKRMLAELAESLPEADREWLLSRIVVIDPFDTHALVPFGVLRREPGVEPAVTAYDVAGLVSRLGGAELGVRQDALIYSLALLGVDRGFTLPRLADLLANPTALMREAALSDEPDVRAFFARGPRVSASSLEGAQARLARLLRLRSSRLMLGSEESIDFRRLLAGKLVLVDVGSPPFGSEDVGRFWAGLVTVKLIRGVFERTHADANRPVIVAVDEWQEGLRAAGSVADDYERVLSMARSRGVGFWLVSQSLAGAARVSAALPRAVRTNMTFQMLFRTSSEDVQMLRHALPLSGRRPRAVGAPWETAARSPFLSRDEERAALEEEMTRLPQQVFRFLHRDRPYGAELVRATDVRLGRAHNPQIVARADRGALARPIAELEQAQRETTEVRFEPRTPGPAIEPAATTRSRRPRRR
jgi:hypothetical protein